MEFELKCEGFCLEDALKDRLLIAGRRAVVAAGWDHPLIATIRLIEGRMQARLELFLPGRRIYSIVWRDDPVEAMERAVDALISAAVGGAEVAAAGRIHAPSSVVEISTLQ
jgi:hypothetical protein